MFWELEYYSPYYCWKDFVFTHNKRLFEVNNFDLYSDLHSGRRLRAHHIKGALAWDSGSKVIEGAVDAELRADTVERQGESKGVRKGISWLANSFSTNPPNNSETAFYGNSIKAA